MNPLSKALSYFISERVRKIPDRSPRVNSIISYTIILLALLGFGMICLWAASRP